MVQNCSKLSRKYKLDPKLQNSLVITCGWSLVGGNSTQQEGRTQNKRNMMVLLILTNCSHQPSFYSLCQIFGHSSFDHTIWDLHLPNMEKKQYNSNVNTIPRPLYCSSCTPCLGLYLGCNNRCGCDKMNKWVWLHVLLLSHC